MNVPLDNLYHFLQNHAEKIHGDHVVIYRFWPNGSKNIDDLNPLLSEDDNVKRSIFAHIWCNDQEPLDHKFYKNNLRKSTFGPYTDLVETLKIFPKSKNLNYRKNIFEKNLLLHSEKRSRNLEDYKNDNELIAVYYWSHALIARDWFRYAELEVFKKDAKKLFLIYNRAWSNTREYRLAFTDLLIKKSLINQCQTSCNPIDPGSTVHYKDHVFKNPQWKPSNVLENFFVPTLFDASSSADFTTLDYEQTEIEVVLETLFDDDRLHLTEKSLRPIACGQPFILAATHGSLEYVRSYGFKTFDSIWDESYDLVEDPKTRLELIVDLMEKISQWDCSTLELKLKQAKQIADFNKQWFFSKDFFDLVVTELDQNLELAFKIQNTGNNYRPWIDHWTQLLRNPEVIEFLNSDQIPTKASDIEKILQIAQKKLSAEPTDI